MLLLLFPFLLWKKTLSYPNSLLQKIVKKETAFIKDVLYAIKNLSVSDLSDINKLEDIVNSLTLNIESAWRTNSKYVNIIRHSKSWWNKKCNQVLCNYKSSRIRLNLPSDLSLISKFKRSSTKNGDLGNS